MRNKKSYKDFRGILDYLKSGESTISSNEKDLVFALDDIVQIDRSNTMIKDLFSKDDKFKTLLYVIEDDIKNADMIIKSGVSNNTQKYIIRKDRLTELRDNILFYLNNQDIDFEDTKNDLIEKCLPTLNLNHYKQQVFFGKPMINEDLSLNKDTITRVYDILGDSDLMEELVVGVERLDEEEKYNKVIRACSEARRYKSKVYDNRDLIIEYNKTSKELYELKQFIKKESDEDYNIKYQAVTEEINDLLRNKIKAYFNKNKLRGLMNQQNVLDEKRNIYESSKSKYEKLNEKIKSLEEKLKKVGLLDFINRNNSTDDKSSMHSLSRMIGYFYDKKGIDSYYNFIDTEYKLNRENLREVRKDNRVYLGEVSPKARNLLVNCSDTCRVISEFANYPMGDFNICPAVSLFILNGLVTIEDSSYDEKEFTVEEVNSIGLYYKDVIDTNYNSFLSEYSDIKSKTGRNYKKKIKE